MEGLEGFREKIFRLRVEYYSFQGILVMMFFLILRFVGYLYVLRVFKVRIYFQQVQCVCR